MTTEAFAADVPDGPERWIKEFYALAAASILAYGEQNEHRLGLLDKARALEKKLLEHIRCAGSETERSAMSSIEYQQRRGMLADTVDWAILEYNGYMADDAYDAQAVLDKIINRLREVRDMLNGK